MTTTQIGTVAAIIRHAIINAERFDDNRNNRFTWECLFEQHGAEAMADAECYLPSDFNRMVDIAREAIATARNC
ncbi:hypothetical protein [Acinetobacter baumannii]|uniref:hypothetical protein n=1 Tax=Acinetobacter baumannii TaxID=470 RepID=UPI001B37B8C8|nr:hypothetical protein [Acinetobacter baumannii]MBQ0941673.1 hypothetical protein [Acinetobacter baumannii]